MKGSRGASTVLASLPEAGPRTTPPDRRPSSRRLAFPEALRGRDPYFSGALFREYALLVHSRIYGLLHDKGAEGLLSTLATRPALYKIRSSLPRGVKTGLVTVGHHTVDAIVRGGRQVVVVTFFGNVTLLGDDRHDEVILDREEVWVFTRPAHAVSPAPERLRALSCHGCGSTEDPGYDGHCPACHQPRTEGAPQWRVTGFTLEFSERVAPLELPTGGGREPGLSNPTVRHPHLRRRHRAFLARHPGLELHPELLRLGRMFVQIQTAWSGGAFEQARPLMSDALFTANRGWLAQLDRQGLRNRTRDWTVEEVQLCDVDTDAWVETITVRIRARCCDWTEHKNSGTVVGGSKREPRVFSEYWTFMRSVGARRKAADLHTCPSCGGGLDQMGMHGVCGYCGSKVSSGQFDWVASRISQDDDVERPGDLA